MQKDRIKIEGHVGTWYVLSKTKFRGEMVYLLEHEKYGEDASCLIVNEDLEVIVDDVVNGFDDLPETL